MRARALLPLMLVAAGCSSNPAQLTRTWPPSPELRRPTIAATVAASPDLSALRDAMRAAELERTPAGPSPRTLFAPSNAAFSRLAPGTMEQLEKPENRRSLAAMVTYWIVPGVVTAADLRARVAAGGGRALLATVEGEPLTVTLSGDVIELTDSRGDRGYMETADLREDDGLIHIINGVLVPAALG